jgi:predicted transposase YbfD/YdcC
LGQQAVDGKSNEITAIPKLLEILDVTGAIVTIDAMGCQKEIAQQIEVCGGDYVLALKENHETLYRDVCEVFREGLENDFAGMEHHGCRTQDEDHGRQETRYYHVVSIPEELSEKHADWVGLRTLGMVYCERQVGDAEPTAETRFYISSLTPKVKTFARAVRGHWGIENSLHWVLDVSFREDESRLRVGHGPENLALLRRMAASILQNEKTKKIGVAAKRKLAGWDDEYLRKVLGATLR